MRLMEVTNEGMCRLSNNDGISFMNVPMPEENRLKERIICLMNEGYQPILTVVHCMDREAIVDIHRVW
jgi:hypothetical protein